MHLSHKQNCTLPRVPLPEYEMVVYKSTAVGCYNCIPLSFLWYTILLDLGFLVCLVLYLYTRYIISLYSCIQGRRYWEKLSARFPKGSNKTRDGGSVLRRKGKCLKYCCFVQIYLFWLLSQLIVISNSELLQLSGACKPVFKMHTFL